MNQRFRQYASNPLVRSLYAPSLIFSFSETMLIPVLPLYVASFEVNYGVVGLVVAMDSIGRLLGDVPAGMLLRRMDRKHVMMIGVACVMLTTMLLFFAPSIYIAAALRLVAGMGTALFNVSRHAYVIDAVSLSKRGRAIALFGGVHRVAKVGSPIFAGFVAAEFGIRAPFLVHGLTGAAVLSLLWIYVSNLPPTVRIDTRHPHLFNTLQNHRYEFITAGLGQVLVQMIRNGTAIIVPLYGADILNLTIDQIGLVIGIAAVLEMMMVIPAGIVMDRLGRKYAIVPTFIIQGTGMLLIPLTTGFFGLLAAVSLIGFANGLSSGTMMTIGADLAPNESRGEFLGVWRLIGDTGFAGGPLVVGGIADVLALTTAALVLACVGFAAAGVFIRFVPETLKKHTVS